VPAIFVYFLRFLLLLLGSTKFNDSLLFLTSLITTLLLLLLTLNHRGSPFLSVRLILCLNTTVIYVLPFAPGATYQNRRPQL
jgi:hypothetical protein